MSCLPGKINAGRWEKELRGRRRRSSKNSTDEFLSSGKPCSPKFVVNSSQIAISDGTEDSEEKRRKEMSKTLFHTCLPKALTTTKKPANAWNQKRILV